MSATPSVYFSSLEIKNVRCFGERQVLDLTDNGQPARWSLLVGENGAGKTTLLECLAWMRPEPEVRDSAAGPDRPGVAIPLSHGMVKPALTGEQNEVLETLPRDGSREVILTAKLVFGGAGLRPNGVAESSCGQAKDISVGVRLSFDEQARLMGWDERKPDIDELGDAFHDPLIVAYGANRHLGNVLGVDELDPLNYERLSRSTELYDIEKIFMSLDYAARTATSTPEESILELLKKATLQVLPDDQGDERIEIHPPDVLETGRPSGVYVKTFTGLVRISALSLGYRTTAGWVMDLAWRLLNQYPHSSNPLAEPAIVLIDEIDLHLHPRWQLQIMRDLGTLFPATQFIATSHSPLIVQVAESANLVLLEKRGDTVVIVNDPEISRDLRVDQILTSLLFGVPSPRNERVERLLEQRAELIDKAERSNEEEERLRDIRRQLDELPTAHEANDRVAMDLIRRFASHLEDQGSAGK